MYALSSRLLSSAQQRTDSNAERDYSAWFRSNNGRDSGRILKCGLTNNRARYSGSSIKPQDSALCRRRSDFANDEGHSAVTERDARWICKYRVIDVCRDCRTGIEKIILYGARTAEFISVDRVVVSAIGCTGKWYR